MGGTPRSETIVSLLEREHELERLQTAVNRACEGAGGVVLVEAAAGLGKTSLLRAATELAGDRMLTLSARATELEQEFPFGIVRQLLEATLRSATPERREALLGGAAGPTAAALGLDAPGAIVADPTYATLNGLHWLIASLAEERPLLLLVDDAQWADRDSLRFLGFLVPRIGELAALLVVAARPYEWRPGAPFAATASDPSATAVSPAALSLEASSTLVAEVIPGADGVFASACHQATGGNPFHLRMLVEELRRDGVSPTSDAVDRVLTAGPPAVTQTIVARLARISPQASRLARAVAVLGDDADPRRAAQLAGLETAEARVATNAMLDAGILELADDLRFSHPIIRNAVHRDIGRGDRTALHRRAIALLREDGAAPERIVAHLLAIDPAGDADVVATLRLAARTALQRGAAGSAVDYLRRALAEPPPEAERADVLLELGAAEALVEGSAAVGHLEEALEIVREPRDRAMVAMTLARTLFSAGESRRAVLTATAAIAGLGEGDAELRRRLQAQVLAAGRMEPDLADQNDELARAIRESDSLEGEDHGSKAMVGNLAWIDARSGVPAERACRGAERALEGGALIDDPSGGADFVGATIVLIQADSELALPTLRSAVAAARERSDVFAAAVGRTFACLAHLHRGELADAIAAGEEGLAAINSYGIAIGLPWASGYLAEALVETGDLDRAAAVLERARPPDDAGESGHWLPHVWARARVSAARGDLEAGLDLALECGRRFEAAGGRNPAFVPWRSQAALCLLAVDPGRREPVRLVEEELALARTWGAPRALGAVLRVAGLAAGGDRAIDLLRAAVATLEGSPARLEWARALVELGAAIRRSGRRADAREPLRDGMSVARSCGAVPLAERAYEELRATGARPRKLIYAGVEALTPSERRIARLAAAGRSNREIAQELFLSVKTVEWHLGQVYRKLDIGSRRDLEAALDGN